MISVAEILCEALELPDGTVSDGTLSGDQALAGLENWDSLAVLKLLIACETVEDLAAFLQQQR